MRKVKEKKSDLVKIIEFATGRKLRDYLTDKINQGIPVIDIKDELNLMIIQSIIAHPEIIKEKRLLLVDGSNITGYMRKYKLKSKVKKGRKSHAGD